MSVLTCTEQSNAIFPAIDFLSTFFSILKKKNKNVVASNQLFDSIGHNRDKFWDLFLDIDIRNNCGVYCSQDIEEGITMLQILGAVGKTNPRYEKIILKMSKETADEMIRDCPPDKYTKIEQFADIFLSK